MQRAAHAAAAVAVSAAEEYTRRYAVAEESFQREIPAVNPEGPEAAPAGAVSAAGASGSAVSADGVAPSAIAG